MTKIIGIDLGTSNSAASVVEAGKPVIIPSSEGTVVGGGKAFPSYVAFDKDANLLVGEPARRQAITNPENTVSAFKRKMGSKEKYTLAGKEYTPQQLSAFILQKIKKDAEAFLGQPIQKAVITVPAYFNDSQRQATKDAGAIAGLEVERIINEPTAASLAYGIDKAGQEEKILVFDFGGGTLDVTIMDFGEGVFEVKSTSGDTQLGGTDMDAILVEYIAEEFKKREGIDFKKDLTALQRVKEAAEKAKIELSSTLETEINLPFLSGDTTGPKHLVMKITRAKLEELVKPIVEKCRGPLEQALNDSKLTPKDITKIILVGGPTRMPMVQQLIENYIGKKIERGVDPMECVAKGAAIQAAVLAGDMKDVLLLDVTPLTLGIETLGAVMTPLIERNTTIPTSKSQIFSTAADNQPSVEIHILQGERPMAADNRTLGRFMLDGIAPAPRGVPQIEVAFDIDANGILNVKAVDKATGKEQKITIQNATNLSKEEVEKLKTEAEKHAEEDKSKKELAEARNHASSVAFEIEKQLKEHGPKLDADTKSKIEENVKKLKELCEKPEVSAEDLKKAAEETLTSAQKIGEVLAKQQTENNEQKTENNEKKDEGNKQKTKNKEQKSEDKGKAEEGEVVE